VTDLGVWDGNGGGLADSHIVTIWTSTGTFVTSGTVLVGTSGTLVDDFRYVSIAPTLLAAGNYWSARIIRLIVTLSLMMPRE
jgi:hypothetical protein